MATATTPQPYTADQPENSTTSVDANRSCRHRKGKELFLLTLFRRRLEYPALKRAVREQHALFGANVV